MMKLKSKILLGMLITCGLFLNGGAVKADEILNEQGYMRVEKLAITYGAEGGMVQTTKYECVEEENRITGTEYDQNGKPDGRGTDCFYDENWKLIREIDYENDPEASPDGGKTAESKYIYDDAGNCIRVIEKDRTGKKAEFRYKYDKDGNCVQASYMDNDGKEKVSWKSEYISDEEGKKCRIMYFDENGEVNSYGENTYDFMGNILHSVSYDMNGDISMEYRYTYEYDKEGRMINSVYYKNGKADSAVEYVYDDNGNCVLETHKDADGKPVQIFAYKYEKIKQE